MENRAFGEMLKAARAWLEGRDPEDIARRTGFVFDRDASAFRFCSLGQQLALSWPDCRMLSAVEEWHRLVILHYMHRADGFPPLDSPVSFSQMRDGMIRGGGFDRDSAQALAEIARDRDEACLGRIFARIGGKRADSKADLCFRIDYLPRCPLTVQLWLADEEFPAEGRLLADASIDHHLTVEDAVTMGSIVLERLRTAAREEET